MISKSTVAILFVIFFGLFLIGCDSVPALNPLFSESERISDSRLLGEWRATDADEGSFCKFKDFDRKSKSYKIEIGGQDYSGSLGKIGDATFIDVVPVEEEHLPNKGIGKMEIIKTDQGYGVKSGYIPISDQLFLDFRGNEKQEETASVVGEINFHVRPLHKIYMIRIENDLLTISYLDGEKLKSLVESGKISLAYQEEPFFLITADSVELRELLRVNNDGEELFHKLDTFRKVPE